MSKRPRTKYLGPLSALRRGDYRDRILSFYEAMGAPKRIITAEQVCRAIGWTDESGQVTKDILKRYRKTRAKLVDEGWLFKQNWFDGEKNRWTWTAVNRDDELVPPETLEILNTIQRSCVYTTPALVPQILKPQRK